MFFLHKNDYKQKRGADEVDEDNIKSKYRLMFIYFRFDFIK